MHEKYFFEVEGNNKYDEWNYKVIFVARVICSVGYMLSIMVPLTKGCYYQGHGAGVCRGCKEQILPSFRERAIRAHRGCAKQGVQRTNTASFLRKSKEEGTPRSKKLFQAYNPTCSCSAPSSIIHFLVPIATSWLLQF